MYKSSQGNTTADKLIYGQEVEAWDNKENVRTFGQRLYATRRVASPYMWEYYVIGSPAARSK